jgi:Putative transposase.
MTLSVEEFTRRFALHILPNGFVRIRHYGILNGSWKRERLPGLRRQLGIRFLSPDPQKDTCLHRCSACKTDTLITLITFKGRVPPEFCLCGQTSVPC